jgi:hypothetical protein
MRITEASTMAVNIEQELQSQLNALDDKLAGMAELQVQRERIANALGVLTGTMSVGTTTKAKPNGTGAAPVKTMSDIHRAKIKLSNLKRRSIENPKDTELARKVADVEALISSLG